MSFLYSLKQNPQRYVYNEVIIKKFKLNSIDIFSVHAIIKAINARCTGTGVGTVPTPP